jgi:hypothetical protein
MDCRKTSFQSLPALFRNEQRQQINAPAKKASASARSQRYERDARGMASEIKVIYPGRVAIFHELLSEPDLG